MTLNNLVEGKRRYQVIDLIGRGGGGCVYRARMDDTDGFTKEVALKVLRNTNLTADDISRFRDEARILGLVRDRAIVNVDPPIRLGERWAIVMEFVDGASAQRLIKRGPIPARPALEIVGEVARVLHKVYSQPGPDGRPLQLVHRDLKPANLQITPDGDVKLLDFGVASARFESREAVTTNNIGGTRGYIAPERLRGVEGPEGDIYSLGVLLHVLVTGERAVDLSRPPEIQRGEDIEQVVALAEWMRDPSPAQRPTAQEVQRQCAELATLLGGPTLRQWAPDAVPPTAPYTPDELVGLTLTEKAELFTRTHHSTPRSIEPAPRRLWIPVLAVGALATATLGLSVALVAALWMGLALVPQPPVAGEPVLVPVPVAVPADVPVPAEGPVPASPVPASPGEAQPPTPVPQVAVRPASPAAQPPRPAVLPAPAVPTPAPVVQPAAMPTPAPGTAGAAPSDPVALAVMTFESEPPGATVHLNGVAIGRTPLRGQPVSHGVYELRLENGQQSIVRTIRIGSRGSTSYRWQGDQLLAR
jgi:hypothetical protein